MSESAAAPRGGGDGRSLRLRPGGIFRAALVCLGLASGMPFATAQRAPVMVQSAPGRFEISAVDPTVAHGVAAAAEEAWRVLAAPLLLPDLFPSPVYFRVTPVDDMAVDAAPFRVMVETGGIVSVRLRADAATLPMTRRALVQSLLMRLAVAKHGITPYLTAPLWLEHACVGFWQTRVDASQLDASKYLAARGSPPSVEELVNWKRGEPEPAFLPAASVWLLAFFQSESGRAAEWPALLLRLLKGDDPLLAVALSFPGRFSSAEGRELWWRTGYHQLRRVRTLPGLEAAESRDQITALARFVFADASEDRDVIVSLPAMLARSGEPIVSAELTRRTTELSKLIPTLHPFYRNAGLSLGEALAARTASAAKRERACAAFEQDWRDATELEAVTRQALDDLERRTSSASPP